MEIAKLVLEYIRVLEWPVLAMVIAFLFRNELSGILGKLRKADLPGGVSLDFNQEMKEAKTLSQEVVRQIEATPVPESRRLMPGVPLTEANARMISLALHS
jgi:hypothetical protein